jgi:alkylhydroperoxidase family enzyme
MAWIVTQGLDGAAGELEQQYRKMLDPQTGRLDNIMAVHSAHPAGLAAHFDLYRAVMRGSASLRKVDRELMAMVLSQQNGCHY